jgi:hypothetical protein
MLIRLISSLVKVFRLIALVYIIYLLSCPVWFKVHRAIRPNHEKWAYSAVYAGWNIAVDYTPLRAPLLWWCNFLGVREAFAMPYNYRMAKRLYQRYGPAALQFSEH